MLLKVGTYQDVQSVLDGQVTRNVGVKVLNGSETWTKYSESRNLYWSEDVITDNLIGASNLANICTHFAATVERSVPDKCFRFIGNLTSLGNRIYFCDENITSQQDWVNYLRNQYNALEKYVLAYCSDNKKYLMGVNGKETGIKYKFRKVLGRF